MNTLDDGTDEEIYKPINRDILDGNVMNISLVIMKHTDDSSCHG